MICWCSSKRGVSWDNSILSCSLLTVAVDFVGLLDEGLLQRTGVVDSSLHVVHQQGERLGRVPEGFPVGAEAGQLGGCSSV